MHGYAHPDFAGVARVFAQQLARTSGGASVCVYHHGEPVVDLWGGFRDDEGDPWTRDTLALCASTTKGVTATALHVLADRGLVDYDEPVATYWPEFGQNGKSRITVRHVLTHSAGMHRIANLIDHGQRTLDWDHMVHALERAAPAYRPGTATGYHALTFGWLVGEIVRRVSGRPIDGFVRTELAEPLGLDGLHIGCPRSERHRAAPLAPMGVEIPLLLRPASKVALAGATMFLSTMRAPVNVNRLKTTFAPRGMEDVLMTPEVLDAVMPAVNGFFSAESLAALYAMLAASGELNGVRLLSPATVRALSTVQNRTLDRVLVMPMHWRLGYHRLLRTGGALPRGFGHFGFGGSGAWADCDHDLAMAMVCNRGTGTPVGDLRIVRLTNAAARAAAARDGVRSTTASRRTRR